MLQVNFLKEHRDRVLEGLKKRNFKDLELVDSAISLDDERKKVQFDMDSQLAEINKISKEIGLLMKEGKKEEAENIKTTVADLKAADKALQEIMDKAQADMTHVLLDIPNIPNKDVPEGKDASCNVVIKEDLTNMPQLGDEALCHWDLQ